MSITSARTRNGDPVQALRLEPPNGQARRPRLSWIAAGLAIVLVSGLLGAITLARVADRQPVLALGQPLERGEALTLDHLRAVEVAADSELPLVRVDDRSEIIGMVAVGPLPAGTLLTRDHLAASSAVPDGWTVVGLALQPGQYPVGSLRAGDRVMVVLTPPRAGSGDGSDPVTILTESAQVFSVEPVGETARGLLVSVAVPADIAPAVASAGAQGRATLVLVDVP